MIPILPNLFLRDIDMVENLFMDIWFTDMEFKYQVCYGMGKVLAAYKKSNKAKSL